MNDPIVFQFSNPATWVPSILAGCLGVYMLARRFKKDNRDDKQEKQVDQAIDQIIKTLRAEVDRLAKRVTDQDKKIKDQDDRISLQSEEIFHLRADIERCHREREELLARTLAAESAAGQPQLI